MTVPGGNVVPWDRKLTSFEQLKIKSLGRCRNVRKSRGAFRAAGAEKKENLLQARVLRDLAVLQATDREGARVLDDSRRYDRRPDGARPVEAFGVAGLRLGQLRLSARHVIGRRVAEDVAQGVGLAHVLASLADDDGQL